MTDFVTVIRRKVVYEEVVITRGEFDAINSADGDEFCEFLDSFETGNKFDPNIFDEDTYLAFPGNVVDRSDDLIFELGPRKKWVNDAPIPLTVDRKIRAMLDL